MISNKYGYFTEDSREFVIKDPRTPRPWFNYMWNSNYAGMVSHTGGGFSFLDCPRDNRINRMRYNTLPWDRPGRYVIVKDAETGEFWSLSWAPTIDLEYDKYEARHGQGYTKITTEIFGIRGVLTYFVPRDTNTELWKVKLENISGKERKLEIYSFTELMMGNALNDIINQPNDKHFTDIHFNEDNEALVATRRYWVLNKKVSVAQPNIDWKYNLIFTSSLKVTGFDGSLDKFIGKWRSEANPVAVTEGKMFNTEITAGDPVAALQSKETLAADGSLDFSIIMGIAPKDEDAFEHLKISDLKKTEVAEAELNKVVDYWSDYLGYVYVETPDEKVNTMLNVWNQYQTAVTFDMARNAGYYHGGLLFGTGMRDQFQDILGMVIPHPERVRARLLNALQFQFSDGSTLHNYFKLTGSGERTHHSDTPLWIPFGLVEYLNETGDFSILDETVKYHDEGEGTVYEHMVKALDFAISATTERGMPKIMNGDWNDTLDHIGPLGKGETIWGAFFLGYVLKKSLPVLELKNDKEVIERWNAAYETIRKVSNDDCWDGDWYVRAFRDNGEVVGSDKNKQGKIFLNAQTWSVISGLAEGDRAEKALEACKKHLLTPYGMQICWPSYTEVEDNIGLISRCVPGKKENGAVFNHASSWFVLAAIMNDDVESALEVYRRMLPVNSSANIDQYETEPYVFSEYLTSPDHETENQASHSWLTGSSVWMYRIALDYIIGFKTSLNGVEINPHIPAEWGSFKATRKFRGKTINLEVKNPEHKNSGFTKLTVNGEAYEGNVLDIEKFDKEVIMVTAE